MAEPTWDDDGGPVEWAAALRALADFVESQTTSFILRFSFADVYSIDIVLPIGNVVRLPSGELPDYEWKCPASIVYDVGAHHG
jgi:hypothetical protein